MIFFAILLNCLARFKVFYFSVFRLNMSHIKVFIYLRGTNLVWVLNRFMFLVILFPLILKFC